MESRTELLALIDVKAGGGSIGIQLGIAGRIASDTGLRTGDSLASEVVSVVATFSMCCAAILDDVIAMLDL